jgi:putative ABC transport system permease protein
VVNGSPFTVIGVAPSGFRGLTPGETTPDFWIPILMRDAIQPTTSTAWRERVPSSRDRWLAVVGRLAPGASVAAVQTEMTVIADRIHRLDGDNADEGQTALVTAEFRWYPSSRTSLLGLTRVLLVTVGLLLAVAVANVTILLLARASARNREIGIRSALGAGRVRVARQLLVESLLLGAGGCAAGLALSIGAARVAGSLLPVRLDIAALPDPGVFAFAAVLSFAAALLAGLFPALRAARTDVVGMIHGRDRGAGGGRLRDGLVVLQTALSLVLVAGAALFSRSLASARSTDLGFEDRGVLYVGVNLRNHGYDEARGRAFVDDVLDRLRGLPGVSIATLTRQVPFRGDWSTDLEPWDGRTFADGRDVLTTGLNLVGPRYFEAMGMPIVRGRPITDADRPGGPLSIVVNQTFARLAYPDGDPVGQSVPLSGGQDGAIIVGVARDATYYELAEDSWAQAWLAYGQVYQSGINFLIKTAGDPRVLVDPVQQAIHTVDPDIAFTRTETLDAVAAEQTARYRASASVVGLSGLIALLLASAGLYGVMAYRVSRRTREIGVRIALGATGVEVAGRVLARSLALVLLGSALGMAGAIGLGRFVEGMVFGISASDPLSLAVAPAVLLVVALFAVLQPARRAAAIDPMEAMRTE